MAQRAFTLIELLVVISVIATLAVLLLPMLAASRASTAKAGCAANLRQLGAGITRFAGDHGGMYPPAGDSSPGEGLQISWDAYINFYITGVHLTSKQLTAYEEDAFIPKNQCPGVLLCPADIGPDSAWVASLDATGHPPGRRTYAMNVSSAVWGVGYQINVYSEGYQLPTVLQGVGVYWDNDINNMLNAPSLKTSVVLQPANLILLAEESCGNNVANSVWPCICMAPYSTYGSGNGELCQVSPADPNNQGAALYASHGNTFNYLFCDNHVAALTMQQTVGNGTITNGASYNGGVGPKAYWVNNTNYTAN